jgi:hypothetical protein
MVDVGARRYPRLLALLRLEVPRLLLRNGWIASQEAHFAIAKKGLLIYSFDVCVSAELAAVSPHQAHFEILFVRDEYALIVALDVR